MQLCNRLVKRTSATHRWAYLRYEIPIDRATRSPTGQSIYSNGPGASLLRFITSKDLRLSNPNSGPMNGKKSTLQASQVPVLDVDRSIDGFYAILPGRICPPYLHSLRYCSVSPNAFHDLAACDSGLSHCTHTLDCIIKPMRRLVLVRQ